MMFQEAAILQIELMSLCLTREMRINFQKLTVTATRYVHRLVAIAFIDNPYNYKEINHKDENKKNNSSENLEWCTRQYNNTYGSLTENKKKKVLQYTKDGVFIASYNSIFDAHKATGANANHIGNVCRNERKSSGGYWWRYA